MNTLAWPMYKGEPELNVEEKNGKEIVTGSRYCLNCDECYPIIDAIPNLLPPE
ncbi:MAG: hypothetical protein V3V23_06170 [Dehalococcoidales bacterium]